MAVFTKPDEDVLKRIINRNKNYSWREGNRTWENVVGVTGSKAKDKEAVGAV